MGKYTVDFYEKENGESPGEEFIERLSPKMRAKVLKGIDLLEENGPMLGMPHSKPLGNQIFELRSKQGSNASRCLYFFFTGKKIIITHGFIKKTEKTPPGQIKRAEEYRADYERRHKENE